jgi:hypothetical protein
VTASALVCGLSGALAAGTAKPNEAPAAPVGSILVSGALPLPRTFATYELAALPQRTVSITYGGVTHTESGPLISDLMTFLGWQPIASCRNDLLRWWILASNAKGRSALVTRGEIDPNFGNRPAILSIAEDGKFLTHVGPRLIVPGDATDIRAIRNVNQLTIGRATSQLPQPGCDTTGALTSAPTPGSVLINGDVTHGGTTTFSQLQAMTPQVTQTVNFLNGTTPVTNTEVGPLLQQVVTSAAPKFDSKCPTDKMQFYVEATGSDGYTSLLSWGDIDPSAGNRVPALSLAENGASLATVGPRVLSPGDIRGGRYVSGTVALTLVRAKPKVSLPACT